MKLHERKERLEVGKSDLSGSVFDDVNLSGCTFHNVNLSGASVDDVNMSGWRVHRVTFRGLAPDPRQSCRRVDRRQPLRGHDDRRNSGLRDDRSLQGCTSRQD